MPTAASAGSDNLAAQAVVRRAPRVALQTTVRVIATTARIVIMSATTALPIHATIVSATHAGPLAAALVRMTALAARAMKGQALVTTSAAANPPHVGMAPLRPRPTSRASRLPKNTAARGRASSVDHTTMGVSAPSIVRFTPVT
jgi:hypothetical protein